MSHRYLKIAKYKEDAKLREATGLKLQASGELAA
jgi:hypothetical protein